jgi:DNA-binding LacI/PurR family transcriptional regulator/DNA-binding transcriptional regulator YhcF (GntR family)
MSLSNKQERPPLLHQYIAEQLRQYIVQEGLTAHEKIPSEVDLAARYQVSRGTIMKALEMLVQEGICYRLRPQGTFVAASPRENTSVHESTTARAPSIGSQQQNPPTIGLVLPYLSSTFLSNILLSVETVTRMTGYVLSFAYSEFDWALEQYHIQQFLRQGAAGIIIYPGDHAVEWRHNHFVSSEETGRVETLQHLQNQGIPFVLLDRYVPEIDCDYIVCDNKVAGYVTTQHLVELGHQRIGFISIAPHITASYERYVGYVQCLQAHALPIHEEDALQSLHWSFSTRADGIRIPGIDQAGYDGVCDYLRREDRPDAVVVLNDTVAWCVIKAAEEVGLRVPDDLAVVCCGGGNPEVYGRIPLTSIAQPSAEMGQQGAYLLLDRIAKRSSSTRHINLPVNLVVRESSGALQHASSGISHMNKPR